MAVFRVEKTSNYTIMANYHLKSRDLSLKAKGLLSVILSLPEEWDYTLKGLSIISREGVDSIRKAVKELETAGYIVRSRRRNELGQLGAADYVIYEFPQTVLQPEPKKTTPPSQPESKQAYVHQEQPISEKPVEDVPALGSPAFEPPMLEKHIQEKPTQENPMLEMSTQLNTNRSSTYSSTYSTDQKTQQIINPSIKNPSINPANANRLRAKVELQLEYDILCENHKFDKDRIDEIVDLIVETLCSSRSTIAVAGDELPAELVKDRLGKLDASHIDYVLDSIKKTTTEVRNIKKYLLTALFNAPATINSYYTADFQHQYYGGGKRV